MSFPITKQIRQEKRAEALARDEAYKKQTLKEKLANAGAKERTKLMKGQEHDSKSIK